jgi:molybdate transport system substrate-binding protein
MTMKSWSCAIGTILIGLSSGAMCQAAELIVLTNQGAVPGVHELAAAFARTSGHKVTVLQEVGAALEQRLNSGPADLITLNPEAMEGLAKKGKVVGGTVTPFTLAGLGVSVRAGAPKPDISTVEAYRATLLAAKSIGYSRGCSGQHAAAIMQKIGIADQIKDRVKLTGGGPVVEYLAKGDFEVGIQQTNVMHGVSGSDYVGHIPTKIDQPCQINVAVLAVSKQPDVARQMIKFMTSLDAISWLQKGHLEPFRRGT